MKLKLNFLNLLAVFALLAFVPLAMAEKGGNKPGGGGGDSGGNTNTIEVAATFANQCMVADQSMPCAIRSDGMGAYTTSRNHRGYLTRMAISYGRLDLHLQTSAFDPWFDRQIVFSFDTNTRPFLRSDGYVNCNEYVLYGNDAFVASPPPYLAPGGSGLPEVTVADFLTRYEMEFADGQWQPKLDAEGNTVMFDLRTMPSDGTAQYAIWVFHFGIVDTASVGYYMIGHNNVIKDDGYIAWDSGIVQITHPDSNTWIVKPVESDVDQLPWEFAGEALHEMQANAGTDPQGVRHTDGMCDLGHWLMPFELTLTRSQ